MFVIDAKELKKMLIVAKRGVSTRSPTPITAFVAIRTQDKELSLTSNSYTMGYKISCEPTAITEDAEICIYMESLSNLLRYWDDEEIEADYNPKSQSLTFINTKGKSEIKGVSIMEFPDPMSKSKSEISLTVNSAELVDAINRISICSNPEEKGRLLLTGICLKIKDDKLLFLATDSYRAGKETIEFEETGIADEAIYHTIPSINLLDIAKSIKEVGDEKTIISAHLPEAMRKDDNPLDRTTNRIMFESGKLKATTQPLLGFFPDVEVLMTREPKLVFRVNNKKFEAMLNRAGVIADDYEHAPLIALLVNTEKKLLTVVAMSEETGFLNESIPIEIEKDFENVENISIGFNSSFLSQPLKQIDQNPVFEISGAKSPMYIKSDELPEFKYALMPVHIDKEEINTIRERTEVKTDF